MSYPDYKDKQTDDPNYAPPQGDEGNEKLVEENSVKLRVARIKQARKFHDPQFKRMRENSEFAFGLQRHTQEKLDAEEYIANFVNREVNQKVATLYARDPKAVYQRRDRMDFALWDGDPMMKMTAHALVQNAQVMGMPPSPEIAQAQMLLQDISQGEAWRKLVDRVGHTLEKLYAYQCDTQSPDFKYQMKQLVRRVVTTGVGFVRINYVRQGQCVLNSTGTDDSVAIRLKKAKLLLDEIQDDKITEDDARVLEVQSLMQSMLSSLQKGDNTNIEERLEFDFPDATAIIVDPRCKSLKGFIGARWIAQQYIVPLDFIKAYFELPELSMNDIQVYREDGIERPKESVDSLKNMTKDDPAYKPLGCLWEYFDLDTKSVCFMVDGYKCFVQDPEPVEPPLNRFWPIFSLTFNDVEVVGGSKSSIYPPSDVDLLKSPQKEWNRTRQALREHRQQSAPMYITRAGWLTDDGPDSDKEKLSNHESGEVVELQGAPPDGDITKALVAWMPAPIVAAVYDTTPYELDATLVVGTNQPQPQPKAREAATPAVIQEQARMAGANSNSDDLDDLLTELAGAAGEIMLREFSPQTVQRVVGKGAVWPDQNRQDYLDAILLQHVAASSGRPNKSIEIANFERIVPLLMQAGANPIAVIKEGVKRLDDRLDVDEFFPTTPPSPVPAAKPQPQSPHGPAPGGMGQGLQPNAANQPVPLPGQPMQVR